MNVHMNRNPVSSLVPSIGTLTPSAQETIRALNKVALGVQPLWYENLKHNLGGQTYFKDDALLETHPLFKEHGVNIICFIGLDITYFWTNHVFIKLKNMGKPNLWKIERKESISNPFVQDVLDIPVKLSDRHSVSSNDMAQHWPQDKLPVMRMVILTAVGAKGYLPYIIQ